MNMFLSDDWHLRHLSMRRLQHLLTKGGTVSAFTVSTNIGGGNRGTNASVSPDGMRSTSHGGGHGFSESGWVRVDGYVDMGGVVMRSVSEADCGSWEKSRSFSVNVLNETVITHLEDALSLVESLLGQHECAFLAAEILRSAPGVYKGSEVGHLLRRASTLGDVPLEQLLLMAAARLISRGELVLPVVPQVQVSDLSDEEIALIRDKVPSSCTISQVPDVASVLAWSRAAQQDQAHNPAYVAAWMVSVGALTAYDVGNEWYRRTYPSQRA